MLKANRQSLDETLQATSDVLFPADLGEAKVTIFSRDCDGDTPLHVMVRRADNYAVQQLIEAGSDVNAIGDMGETPLHTAVYAGSAEIIKLLLAAGARDDIRSEFGDTQLERAINIGGEVAKLLRK